MSQTHFHDVTIELVICGNSEELVATVEFTATPVIPATYDDPAEGGEVEVVGVVDLFIPEREAVIAGEHHHTPGAVLLKAKPRVDLERPAWLIDFIIANVDEEVLYNSVDFDDYGYDDDWQDPPLR